MLPLAGRVLGESYPRHRAGLFLVTIGRQQAESAYQWGAKNSESAASTRKWSDWPPSPAMAMSAAFILVCAVAGATWAIARSVTSERINNLESQIDATQPGDTPPTTGAASEQPQFMAELSAKLESVEKEKQALVAQLAELSRDALDPRSEIGILVQQLESGDVDERMAAATGLFSIRDSLTVQPLVDYYRRDPDEATRVEGADSYMYRALSDERIGNEFVISVLESKDEYDSKYAFDVLSGLARPSSAERDEFEEGVRSAVESLALNSKDPLVRTRAKVILERREQWEATMKEIYGDNWSQERAPIRQ